MDQKTRQNFDELFEAHHAELIRYVGLKSARRVAAEDIVSEAFIRLWEKLCRGEVIQNPRALLYHIARGLMIDGYRREALHDRIVDGWVEDIFTLQGEIAESDAKRDLARILEKMQELKAEYAEVLHLHYVEGLPFSDIATIIEESENNVRVRVHRALEKLRATFSHE